MVEYRLAAGNRRPTPQRRRARRPLLAALGAGAVLAAVAATAVALVLPGGQPAPASPAAVELLANVANAAARQPTPHVTTASSCTSGARSTTPTVQRRQPAPTIRAVARAPGLAAGGQHLRLGFVIRRVIRTSLAPAPGIRPSGAECGIGNIGDPTYRLLQSLPTDPRTLLNLIYAFDGPGAATQEQGKDGEAFNRSETLSAIRSCPRRPPPRCTGRRRSSPA